LNDNLKKTNMSADKTLPGHMAPHSPDGGTRRDFLQLTAAAFGAVGAGCFAWPLVDSLNPARDTLALATTEVDLTPIEVGQSVTVIWQGKPVFIRRRTTDEIKTAQDVNITELRDKQTDQDRVKKAEWLVVVGICTHLGCIPQGQKVGETRGDYNGWFCPCHGSAYDTSGRIRSGPAPTNMSVPPYEFLTDSRIKIG